MNYDFRRTLREVLALTLVLPFIVSCTDIDNRALENSKKPNIVVFLVDDLGWQDTSLHFGLEEKDQLDKQIKTPNIEKLYSMGSMFTNAYSTPVCSPSRISLITGMNAARHRVTNWTLFPDVIQPMEENHPTLSFPFWNVNGLGLTDTLANSVFATPLPTILRENGYSTIHIGKGHFGSLGYSAEDPLNLGFDINIGGHAAGAPASYLGVESFGNNGNDKENVFAVPGLEAYHGQDIFLTEALTRASIEELKSLNTDKPFFLYFSYYGVHIPITSDDRFVDKYTIMGMDPIEASYASMIESVDHSIGDIMSYLENKNLLEDTIIIFMSDNGGLSALSRGGQAHTHNRPLNSGKGSVYEGGIRVPMLIYHPKLNLQREEFNTPVIIEDLFPTILDFANIEHVNTVQEIDGRSLKPLLYDSKREDFDNRPLFWHYPNDWGPEGPGIGAFSAIRYGNWKLIYYHDSLSFELFNLSNDIGETVNLFDPQASISQELAELLSDHLQETNAQMPTLKSNGLLVPFPNEVLESKSSE